jgi:hypothetical protein
MKRFLGLGFLLALFSIPLLAAKSSQVFLLPSDVRVGDVELPEGHCTVTWTDMTGPQVQLTIKTADNKTITIPAKVIAGKQREIGVETFVANGVTYLLAFHSPEGTFIVQDAPKELK